MSKTHDQVKRISQFSAQPVVSLDRSTRRGVIRGALIISSLALFAGAAALGMVQPSPNALDTPTQQMVTNVVSIPPAVQADIAAAADNPAGPEHPFITETRVRSGDTVSSILRRLDINDPSLLPFLTRDQSARSVYRLVPGRTVQVAEDASGKLVWLRYFHTPGGDSKSPVTSRYLEVTPSLDGYKAREVEETTDTETRVAVGTIRSSLFAATDDADIPDGITSQMAEILGSKIDFLRDLRRGDQFRVVYEMRNSQGRTAGPGKVLALEFINQGKTYHAVWFSPDGKSGAYYDLDGNSLGGAFLRNAIKFSRVSSNFGMRKHPIHNQWSGHFGVDYSAPIGTPIHATADGTVESIGWQNGYGNTIVLKHHNQITTLYAHQSRFAEGLTKGSKVSQGQLIGYVGNTGWSTGPHLHYEFKVAGKPVDPLKVDLPVAQNIDPERKQAFLAHATPIRQQLETLARFQESTAEPTSVASR